MSKKITLKMFSQVQIAMMRECKKHPVLMDLLSGVEQDDWGGALAEISAYCLVVMEGEYMPHELEKLYDILTVKLRKRRQIIVETVNRSKDR